MTSEPRLPGFWGLSNAVTNASRGNITQDGLIALLQGAPGNPSQRRSLFSDVAWSQLVVFAEAAGVSSLRVLTAYERARDDVAAANPEIDAHLAQERALGLYP